MTVLTRPTVAGSAQTFSAGATFSGSYFDLDVGAVEGPSTQRCRSASTCLESASMGWPSTLIESSRALPGAGGAQSSPVKATVATGCSASMVRRRRSS